MKEPNTYITVAGKVTLPYITEDFKIKLRLMDRQDGKAKWHEFTTSCRLAEGNTDDLLIGSNFTDKHYIYRGFDEREWKTKVFKLNRPGEKNTEVQGEAKKEYRIRELTQENVKDMIYYLKKDEHKLLDKPRENEEIQT